MKAAKELLITPNAKLLLQTIYSTPPTLSVKTDVVINGTPILRQARYNVRKYNPLLPKEINFLLFSLKINPS